jgi:hypothetical protein
MKSHPLDQWPIDERDLGASERERLERELEQSPELQKELGAWQAIESSFQDVPMVGPEPGFAGRWQARLTARRERRRQRQVNWLLGALFMGAIAAFLLIGLEALASPAQFGAAGIETVIRVGQFLDAGVRYLAIFGDGWPALLGALALSAALAWISVVWVAAMYRYSFSRIQNGVG